MKLLTTMMMACCCWPWAGHAANLDLGADQRADLWWMNAATGEHWAYQMDGFLNSQAPIAVTTPGWTLVGRGDWDGDGKSDALWQHAGGQLWLYLMDGAHIKQQRPLLTLNAGWRLEAVADWTGDGTDDLLWFHPASGELWLIALQGGQVADSRRLFVATPPWRLLAAVDVDADRKKDLLWRQPETGEVWLTRQDGHSIVADRHWAQIDPVWQLAAVGDFDGNGTDDLWWRHGTSGANALLLTQGDQFQEQLSATVADLNWQPAATGDFNADGTEDILWRNRLTGDNWLYLIQNAQVASQGPLESVPTSWQPMQNPPLASALDSNEPLVQYDFSAGDRLDAKQGWSFDTPDWPLTPVPGSLARGIGFTYPGLLPGNYGWQEMRFRMPPTDGFWLQFRLHIPANYAHRSDTKLDLPASSIVDWQVGDWLVGTDGQSKGVISAVYRQATPELSTGVFLRTPANGWNNATWVGSITNLTRNHSALSTGRAGWSSNNKLLAVWADGYSAQGTGPSVVWELLPIAVANPGQTSRSTELTVHYSPGNHQGAGGHISATGEPFITASDAGHYLDMMVHGQFSSQPGARDGVIQSWVRKEGEQSYQLKHQISDADMDKHAELPVELQQWQAGYLMGWSNSGFDQATQFHISQIRYYRTRPAELKAVP